MSTGVELVVKSKFPMRLMLRQETGETPATDKDFRRILELKEVDAITIATPDHWHTPMAIAGLQASIVGHVEAEPVDEKAQAAILIADEDVDAVKTQVGRRRKLRG